MMKLVNVPLSMLILCGSIGIASAQVPSPSCEAPPDPALLKKAQPEGKIITDETISEADVTVPSLWWAKKQFDPFGGKLIDGWLAYQDERRIDLVVNRQLWSRLDYVNRYRFVNNIGTVAREYKYNLRVFTQQQQCLATYACNYRLTNPQCELTFDLSNPTSLEVNDSMQTE